MPRYKHRLLQRIPRLMKKKGLQNWYVQYWDLDGTAHEVSTGTTEKSHASDILKAKRIELERIAAGLVDESYTHKDTDPLSLVAAFQQHQEDLENSPRYVQRLLFRIKAALNNMQCGDLSALISHGEKKAVRYLRSLKRSAKTRDHYADGLKTFGIWLEKEGLIEKGKNPFAHLPRIGKKGKKTLIHSTLTSEEVGRLVAAAPVRPVVRYLESHPNAPKETLGKLERDGLAVARCYLFAGIFGMRESALRQLRWSDWDREHQTLRIRKGVNLKTLENRDLLVSDPRLVDALEAEHLAQSDDLGHAPSGKDRIFQVPYKHRETLRKDAYYAGLCDKDGYRDDAESSRVTWHGFRHSSCTNSQKAGMAPAAVMAMLGHTNLNTTLRYTHLNAADGACVLESVISTMSPKVGSEVGGKIPEGSNWSIVA
jgi:integrase